MKLLDESVQIDGGWRIAETETHWVDLLKMIYNARIALTPKSCPLVIDRAWCYRNTTEAMLAVGVWDPETDEAPTWWIKEVMTGRYGEFDDAQATWSVRA